MKILYLESIKRSNHTSFKTELFYFSFNCKPIGQAGGHHNYWFSGEH